MQIGKVTIQCALVILFISINACHCTVCGVAQAGPMPMLNGSQLPDKDWLVSTNGVTSLDVTTNGNTFTLNTIGVPRTIDQLPGKAVMWFYREVPFNFKKLGFSIEFTLKVHEVENPHNFNDAGIMFYGSTIDPSGNFAGGPRGQMLFFDEGFIGWGDATDKTQMFEMDTTDTFHTYTLTVDHKGRARWAKVYVDGALALQRNNWEGIPRIGFGDMTNDVGVNGRFSIRDIIVTPHPRPRIPPSRGAPR